MKKISIIILLFGLQISSAQWVMTSGPFDIRSINVIGVYGTGLYAGVEGGGVFWTDDYGESWATIGNGLTDKHISSLTVHNNLLFIGTQNGVFQLHNHDIRWMSLGPFTNYIKALASDDSLLFTATSGSGVYRSSNNGALWTPVNSGLGDLWVRSLGVTGGNIFAGTQSKGVFRSSDSGTSWTEMNSGLSNLWVISLLVTDSLILAGTSDGTFYSTNSGVQWTMIDSGLTKNVLTTCFAAYNGVYFAGTAGNGVFVSSNNGIHWHALNSGFNIENIYITSLCVNGTYLIAGTGSDWIWRRPIGEFLSVRQGDLPSPLHYDLRQNYPNPFNPSTNISFSIPSKSFVTVKIFDLMGKDVATLYNEELPRGNYTHQWRPVHLSSGIYFCCMHAGNYTKTMKIILLR